MSAFILSYTPKQLVNNNIALAYEKHRQQPLPVL